MLRIKLDEILISKLSDLLTENNLTEIEIKDGRKSIRVTRSGVSTSLDLKSINDLSKNVKNKKLDKKNDENIANHPGAVRAPMVGTLYHAPSPSAKPFIELGKKIEKGEVLFIIEAMKTMNQVKSHKAGSIKKILVDNSQPVEFDDILAVIE